MDPVLLIMSLVITLPAFLFTVYLGWILLGFRKSNVQTVRASRIGTTYRRASRGRYENNRYPVGTSRYSYTVDGKTYSIRHEFWGKKPDAPASVSIQYQKKHPQFSRFPGDFDTRWILFAAAASLAAFGLWLLFGTF